MNLEASLAVPDPISFLPLESELDRKEKACKISYRGNKNKCACSFPLLPGCILDD